jgi:hypothetical protein
MFSPRFARMEAAPLGASPCTLAWDESEDANIKGYALCYGINGSTTTNRVDLGLTNQVTFKSLSASSNYFFFVVSYNGRGQTSGPSAVINYAPPALSSLKLAPSTNGTVKICFRAATNAACHVEYAPTLKAREWHTLGNATADDNGNVTIADPLTGKPSSRFYRAAVP